jgi:hypothetical protein
MAVPDRASPEAVAGGIGWLDPVPPVAMVMAAAVSVQFGAALGATLFDELGPGGASLLRQAFAAAILLTTHYLEEAEELCEEIALIRGGRLLARDSAPGLREAFAADSLADVYVKAMASPAGGEAERGEAVSVTRAQGEQ